MSFATYHRGPTKQMEKKVVREEVCFIPARL